MRAFAMVCTALFGTSAAVQWNDPDPFAWVALYGAAAGLSLAYIASAVPPLAYFVLAGVAGLWAASLVPAVAAEASFTANEVERELGGLVLVAAAMVTLGRGAGGSS